MNILRRLPLPRLLLLCGLVVAIGISATALAFAVGSGPVPPPRSLADAVHDALGGPAVEGVSASVTLTDHLLEGASLSGAGDLASSPLVAGASGRLWIAKDGRVRLELQSEGGDTQILYDGHTVTVYDAASNTVYRYTPKAHDAGAGAGPDEGAGPDTGGAAHEIPSVAKIEEAIGHLERHADVSGATPTDVAGQPAYTVRVSPKEGGSLFAGAELSFDAVHGVPLRAAIYSTSSAAPVIELTADAISYGPVEDSVFEITPPAGAKIVEVPGKGANGASKGTSGQRPKETTYGHGPTSVAVLEAPAGKSASDVPAGLPKVTIDGTSATELSTALGTLLSFERSGVRHLLLGSVPAASVEAVARGL
jgi:outer membrane lipoprotein-sorting protein